MTIHPLIHLMPDVPVPTELAHVIAEKIIANLERDDRLTGEWKQYHTDAMAEDIEKILREQHRYVSPIAAVG